MDIKAKILSFHLIIINLQINKLILLLKQRKKGRRWWVKPHLKPDIRLKYGCYDNLFKYFKNHDHEEFYQLTI